MKILSVRKGFQGDHSSTSYEFYAIDKPLNQSQRADVSSKSSRAMPTKRRVSFIYHNEWYDLPGGWEPLVEKYYDVMYRESYDWWNLAMAFNTQPEQISEISQYEFDGGEDMGITVESKGNRVIITIDCRLDYAVYGEDEYSDYDYYEEEEEEGEADDGAGETGNYLLDLLAKNREFLKNGDYRLLYGIWQEYGLFPDEDEEFEEEAPPEPADMNRLPKPIETLLSLLDK